jgi:hypothetical protein
MTTLTIDRKAEEVKKLLTDAKSKLTKLSNVFNDYPQYDFNQSLLLIETLLEVRLIEEHPTI